MSLPIKILSRSFKLMFASPVQTLKAVAPGLVGISFAIISFPMAVAPSAQESFNLPLLIASVVIGVIGWMAFAIIWHRYALLEGDARHHLMRPTASIFGQYFKAALVVGVISFFAALPGGFIVGFVLAILANMSFGTVFLPITTIVAAAMALAFGAFIGWVVLRFSLILPAAATEQKLSYSDSWQATKTVSLDILWTAILVSILNFVAESIATGLAVVLPGFAIGFVILQVAIQSLIYISVLSTLYGHLIQGRSLT